MTDLEKDVRRALADRVDVDPLASVHGVPRSVVRQMARRVRGDLAGGRVVAERPEAPALHLKPLGVKIPKPGKPKKGPQSWVIIPDIHIPFQDDRALAVVAQIIHILDPFGILQIGDLLDAFALSRFPKDPRTLVKFQEEIDRARRLVAAWRLLSPNSKLVIMGGNHEWRLERALWESQPAAQALLLLDAVQEALTWPKLLGLDELHAEYVPYGSLYHLPKMVVKHGDLVRSQSAYTAAAEHRKEGISGISGHTHRIGLYASSDHNGAQTWLEAGHLCDVSKMDYVKRPNWQQGCAVVTFDPETGANAIEIIRIQNGIAVFRDQLIDCSK